MSGICSRCLRHVFHVGSSGLCWSCSEPQRRRAAKRRAEIRRPPDPPFKLVPGVCNLCGGPIPKGRYTWCSQRCVDVWSIATSSRVAAYHLSREFGSVCWGCWGEDEPPGGYDLQVDHVRPLWALTIEERQELRWWLPFNLQLLGPSCHRAKTSREAASRAVMRDAERHGRRVRYVG